MINHTKDPAMAGTPITPGDDTAWNAVLTRDRSFDGRFVTGVLSTGIYCRPSCAARHPRRDNVRFFADGMAARAAGLRESEIGAFRGAGRGGVSWGPSLGVRPIK